MRVLFTGAGGFIGSHCLEYFLKYSDWKLVIIDSFRHKGSYTRLNDISNFNPDRITIYNHDLSVPIDEQLENKNPFFSFLTPSTKDGPLSILRFVQLLVL